DMSCKAIDRYTKDYIEIQTKQGVKVYRTPDSVLMKQLQVFDAVTAKKGPENPLFQEIVDSQKAFAERAVKWYLDTQISPRMSYNYYFAKSAGKSADKKKA